MVGSAMLGGRSVKKNVELIALFSIYLGNNTKYLEREHTVVRQKRPKIWWQNKGDYKWTSQRLGRLHP